MNFFECLSKGYVPPANYFKSDLFAMLGISHKTWAKLYKNAKRKKDEKEITLKEELNQTGYKKNQKQITKKQCSIIFEYIGYPDLSEANKDFLIKNGYIEKKDLEQADLFSK